MSMDLAAFLVLELGLSGWSAGDITFHKWFSVGFGAVIILVALLVDVRNRSRLDYSYWLYLFGLMAFWGGLTSLGSSALSGKLVYLAINLLLVLIGAVLMRLTFTAFGAIGVNVVLGDLSWRFFKDSWLFPIVLSLHGLAIVLDGVQWSRHVARLSALLRTWLPTGIDALMERRAS